MIPVGGLKRLEKLVSGHNFKKSFYATHLMQDNWVLRFDVEVLKGERQNVENITENVENITENVEFIWPLLRDPLQG
jgi:hypothetical protein